MILISIRSNEIRWQPVPNTLNSHSMWIVDGINTPIHIDQCRLILILSNLWQNKQIGINCIFILHFTASLHLIQFCLIFIYLFLFDGTIQKWCFIDLPFLNKKMYWKSLNGQKITTKIIIVVFEFISLTFFVWNDQ